MESKKRFIIITVVLMGAILATVGMSVAWMLETYRSLDKEFSESVQAVLDEAVSLERKISGAAMLDIQLSASAETLHWGALSSISPEEISSITVHKGEEAGGGMISVFMRTDSTRAEGTAGRVNVPVLRSFLDELFHSRGMDGAYSLQIVRKAMEHRVIQAGGTGSEEAYSVRVAGVRGDTTLISYGRADSLSKVSSVSDTLYDDHRRISHAREFRAAVGDGALAECRLLVESPRHLLWGKMGGIVISSVLIALVLCSAFLYLLRTILRLKSIGQMRRDFTHNITHELKTPIAAISAVNEALSDFSVAEDPERCQKYLAVQKHYLQALSSMVERILSLSVQENENFHLCPEMCSLREMIEEEVRTLPLKYKKPIDIRTEWSGDGDYRVCVDRFHFSNVLLNILDNAVKYGSDTPHILIKVAGTGQRRTAISISDDGTGIPASQRKHIFEKYYRIPAGDIHNVRGYGIGLYYCRLVVEKLGGSIRVADNPGGGTVFTIVI